MAKAVAHTQGEFASVRTGRATPAWSRSCRVDYYGTEVPLQQLAGFNVPEARLLVIPPYDKNSIKAIEKAIQHSDLGINPSNDGQVIRLVFPQLTEERRKDLVKVVKHKAEEGRVAVRNLRRAARHDLEALEKDGEISSDELDRAEKELEKLTHEYVAEIDRCCSTRSRSCSRSELGGPGGPGRALVSLVPAFPAELSEDLGEEGLLLLGAVADVLGASRSSRSSRSSRRGASGASFRFGPFGAFDQLVELAAVKPDAAALRAVVDLHALPFAHEEFRSIERTVHAGQCTQSPGLYPVGPSFRHCMGSTGWGKRGVTLPGLHCSRLRGVAVVDRHEDELAERRMAAARPDPGSAGVPSEGGGPVGAALPLEWDESDDEDEGESDTGGAATIDLTERAGRDDLAVVGCASAAAGRGGPDHGTPFGGR